MRGPILLAKEGAQGFISFTTSCILIVFASIPILIAWK